MSSGKNSQVKFLERISQKGFPKKEAGRKSSELTPTLVILIVWNEATNTLDSIENGQETTEQWEIRSPQLLLLFLENLLEKSVQEISLGNSCRLTSSHLVLMDDVNKGASVVLLYNTFDDQYLKIQFRCENIF